MSGSRAPTGPIDTAARARVVWLYHGDHLAHPFIQLAANTLVKEGFAVTVVDRSGGSSPTPYQHRGRPKRAVTGQRALDWLIRSWHTTDFLSWMFRRAIQERPDYIIATLPHAALVGWAASVARKARLIYYPFELFGEQSIPAPWILRFVEATILQRGVDAVITQNQHRAQIYSDERGSRVRPIVVHNYKSYTPSRATGRLRDKLGLSQRHRIVLYEGQLVSGRWLDRLILAARYLEPDTRMVFMGEAHTWWHEVAARLLDDLQIARRVLVAPPVPQAVLLGYVADADVGVIIYDDRVRNNYYCEPGKLTDYVLAGVPVVAPRFPTIAPVIEHYDIGRCFQRAEPEEMAHTIGDILAISRDTWRPRLARAAKELRWETQVPALLEAVTGERKR